MLDPQVLAPGELSAGDPSAAGATTAVPTLPPLSLPVAAPVGAQQSPLAVNTARNPSFGLYVHGKICIEFKRSILSLTLVRQWFSVADRKPWAFLSMPVTHSDPFKATNSP